MGKIINFTKKVKRDIFGNNINKRVFVNLRIMLSIIIAATFIFGDLRGSINANADDSKVISEEKINDTDINMPAYSEISTPYAVEKNIYSGYCKDEDYTDSVTFAAIKGYENYEAKVSEDVKKAVEVVSLSAVSTGVTVSFKINKGTKEGSFTVPVVAEKVTAPVTVCSIHIDITYLEETEKLSVKNGSNYIIVTPGERGKIKMNIKKTDRAYTYAKLKSELTKKENVTSAKIDGTTVCPKVPKKAIKGKKEAIWIVSGDKSIKYDVIPRNKAKKITIKKKSLTIKKSKEKTVTFSVKSENNKQMVADKIKVSWNNPSYARATRVTVKKGKVSIKLKGVKKGSSTFKLCIGSKKSSKIKIKVK